jgi:recombination protein RecA
MSNLNIVKQAQKKIQKDNETILTLDEYSGNELVTGWGKVPTGSIKLDRALNGGIAIGQMNLVYGDKNAGKSTFVQIVMGQFQRRFPDKIIIDIDAERSREDSYAAKLGVQHDKENYVKLRPNKAEDIMDFCMEVIPKGVVSLIVIDSFKALMPKNVVEGKSGDNHMASQARLFSQNLAILLNAANNHDTTLVTTNQVRVDIGNMYGSNEKNTGGKAMGHTPSLILKLWQQKDKSLPTDKDGDPLGYLGGFYIEKSRYCNPFKTIRTPVLFGKGFDKVSELIDIGLEEGFMELAGSWYKIVEDDGTVIEQEQGKKNMRELITQDEELLEFLEEKAFEEG